MAPTYPYYITSIDTTSTYSTTWFGRGFTYPLPKKIETKKQRIARIAKENMLASYKTYNQKTVTVRQIRQVCKPIHRIFRK
jgi:hypothetical protein